MTTNEDGLVTGRKDYSAFGEESFSSQRTSSLGYTGGELRKGYTGYENDEESGLDFAQARYYSSTHGRYTSVDPLTASASIRNPQTFNRYAYVLNSPYKFTDPLGLLPVNSGSANGGRGASWCSVCQTSDDEIGGFAEPTELGIATGHEASHTTQQTTSGKGWVNTGQDTWLWVDQCPEGGTCFTAIAGVNKDNGVTVLGSNGARDVTVINANKNGVIDLNEVANHHNANFLVAKGQTIPEEYLSPLAAIAFFNVARIYGDHYQNDGKLELTAGAEATGNGCVYSSGKKCHQTHDGGTQ
ncbi:MAG: RHS repeat-associated core domain-containing protein [Pyrinomonadaceae bacterium]